jgi:hypothetical protein
MSKPRKKRLSVPNIIGQTKILIAESPGRTALLFEHGNVTPMRFAGAHAALDWCETNQAAFFFMPSTAAAN